MNDINRFAEGLRLLAHLQIVHSVFSKEEA